MHHLGLAVGKHSAISVRLARVLHEEVVGVANRLATDFADVVCEHSADFKALGGLLYLIGLRAHHNSVLRASVLREG